MRSSSRDGLQGSLFGRDPVLASHSAAQGSAAGSMILATFGPSGSGSSEGAALQSSLGNRLRALTASGGSTLFSLTWRAPVTPLGRPIFRLRASALPTGGNGFGSWPTCRRSDGDKGVRTADGAFTEHRRKGAGADLPTHAALAAGPWPTPTRQDAASSGAAGYSTESGRHSGTTLTDSARAAAWATPAAHEAGGTPEQFLERKRRAVANGAILGVSLTSLALQADASGSPAETGKPGQLQLNPAFSCWLMGYGVDWLMCAPSTSSKRRGR